MVFARIELYLGALLQVALVSMNIVFLTMHNLTMLAITGFLISLVWTFNVKKVAFGTWVDRIIYASGACTGTIIGYLIGNYLTHI